jgi:3-oxoacyl-[acyl-carrier-protein] synthase II
MGEGAGVLLMESLEHAQKRGANIICEYLGGALTCDAHHMTDPRPDGRGVGMCIENALKDAGVSRLWNNAFWSPCAVKMSTFFLNRSGTSRVWLVCMYKTGAPESFMKYLPGVGIDREQVNYINAHATSTLVGDIAEVKAVRSVFSDWSNIKMNATKSMVGHCLGAAAGVEAIATIMAMKRGMVHPTINHQVCQPRYHSHVP